MPSVRPSPRLPENWALRESQIAPMSGAVSEAIASPPRQMANLAASNRPKAWCRQRGHRLASPRNGQSGRVKSLQRAVPSARPSPRLPEKWAIWDGQIALMGGAVREAIASPPREMGNPGGSKRPGGWCRQRGHRLASREAGNPGRSNRPNGWRRQRGHRLASPGNGQPGSVKSP
jgi:hypothetical protein